MMKGCDGELKIAPVRSEKLTLAKRRLQSTDPCQRSERVELTPNACMIFIGSKPGYC